MKDSFIHLQRSQPRFCPPIQHTLKRNPNQLSEEGNSPLNTFTTRRV